MKKLVLARSNPNARHELRLRFGGLFHRHQSQLSHRFCTKHPLFRFPLAERKRAGNLTLDRCVKRTRSEFSRKTEPDASDKRTIARLNG
jgi:hypothetical protein